MKLFFDTNVVLDIVMDRMPFCSNAISIIGFADEKEIDICISATSVTTVAYIAQKGKAKVRDVLKKVAQIFTIEDTKKDDIMNAIGLGWRDYEDAVQYSVALRSNADHIITRNTGDFEVEGNDVAVMTPEAFLETVAKKE